MSESVTHGDLTVTSSHESADEMRTALAIPDDLRATAEPATPPAEIAPSQEPEPPESAAVPEPARNPDGTFKAAGSKPKKPRDDPQARINQAIARQREAERKAAQLEQEIASLRQPRLPETTPQPAPAPAPVKEDEGEPQPDKYDGLQYDPRYIRDLTQWHAKQAWQQQVQQQREAYEAQQQQQAEYAQAQAHQERLTAARAKYPDFDQRLNPEIPVNGPTRAIIQSSAVGPELMLYLSDHPDEAQRIATLHPVLAIREMGKLEARFEAAGSGPVSTPPMSTAKPVVKPVTGSPLTVERDEYRDDEPFEAHFKRENARDRAARRG